MEYPIYEPLGVRIRRQKETGISEGSAVEPAFDVPAGEEPSADTPYVVSDVFTGDILDRLEAVQDSTDFKDLSSQAQVQARSQPDSSSANADAAPAAAQALETSRPPQGSDEHH